MKLQVTIKTFALVFSALTAKVSLAQEFPYSPIPKLGDVKINMFKVIDTIKPVNIDVWEVSRNINFRECLRRGLKPIRPGHFACEVTTLTLDPSFSEYNYRGVYAMPDVAAIIPNLDNMDFFGPLKDSASPRGDNMPKCHKPNEERGGFGGVVVALSTPNGYSIVVKRSTLGDAAECLRLFDAALRADHQTIQLGSYILALPSAAKHLSAGATYIGQLHHVSRQPDISSVSLKKALDVAISEDVLAEGQSVFAFPWPQGIHPEFALLPNPDDSPELMSQIDLRSDNLYIENNLYIGCFMDGGATPFEGRLRFSARSKASENVATTILPGCYQEFSSKLNQKILNFWGVATSE